MPTRWFRYRWNEARGDEFADWGSSTWLFATDEVGVVEKQVEIYDGGVVLVYDETYDSDTCGGLSDQPLEPRRLGVESITELGVESITEQEFEQVTGALNPMNRP